MARPKRGQLTQFIAPMRQSSDGSVYSTLTASDLNSSINAKWYGVSHGGSAATTSGALSKTISLVRSGVFRITLNATENNYDEMLLRIQKTNMKEFIAVWNNADYDDSDLMSRLSDIGSDLRSYMVGISGTVSDVYSMLSDLQSDFQSRVPKAVATNSQLSDLASDIRSVAIINQSTMSDLYSMLSDLQSDFQSRVPKRVATDSQLSDVASDLRSYLVGVSGLVSDVHSAVALIPTVNNSDAISNVYSLLALVASNVSDVESQLDLVPTTNHASTISDIYSLLSDLQSDFQSRVPKETAARSQLSDLSSDIRSYLVGNSGVLSDVYSLLVAGPEVGASSMSDIRSAIIANGMQAAGADPTGVVGVTDSYGAKLNWLTAMSRNKLTQTSTSAVLFNDAGTAIASAVVSDDAVTFTRDEWH